MSTKANTAAVEKVIFQSESFNSNTKVLKMMTNAAAIGDAAHFMAYGFTLGGAMHTARRNANWSELSSNVYNQAACNSKLRAFKAVDGSQVAVLGYSYMSIYQSGERQKKVVKYADIERISTTGDVVQFWVRNQQGCYFYVALKPMLEGMDKLLNSLKYYMKKNGQDVTNNANNVMTVNSVASVPKYSEAEKTASVGMAVYGVGIALVAIVMLVAFAGL